VQLTAQWQDHSKAVDTAHSPAVGYLYSTGDNNSRLTGILYPSGRQENYEYELALDKAISRIGTISDSSGGRVRIYAYLSLSTAVAFDGNNVSLTYLNQGDGLGNSDAGDEYTGLDRFGRVIDQNWTGPGGTSIDRFQYGYDADSNVLFKNNLVNSNFSELYAYDPLNRLTAFTRGTLNAAHTAITTQNPLAGSSNNWSLDAIGNITESNGTNRSVNSANELTSVGSNGLAYDNNGNTLTDQDGNTYVYDAWNHVVKVNGTYAYKYDVLGRRIYEGTTGRDLYYNSIGNVIEERNASNSTTMQYVWGMGYVNDLVLLDNYSTGVRLYAEQDANWNVTSLTDSNGNVVERFVYDPYGTKTVLTPSWASTTDAYGMLYGFQGGRQDPTTGLIFFNSGGAGRDLNPGTGTWQEPEPFGGGYISGPNLYQALASNPVLFVDPLGLIPQVLKDLGQGAVNFFQDTINPQIDLLTGAAKQALDPAGAMINDAKYLENQYDRQRQLGAGKTQAAVDAAAIAANNAAGTLPPVEAAANIDLGTGQPIGDFRARYRHFIGGFSQMMAMMFGLWNSDCPVDDAPPKPTEAYNRGKHYGKTPTAADRRTLGASSGQVVDHQPPLVQRYCDGDPGTGEPPGHQLTDAERKASAADRSRMQLQSRGDSNSQGGNMSQYSKEQKRKYGL